MTACADFDAVRRFVDVSLVVQHSFDAANTAVGPKSLQGPHGERGLLVVCENVAAGTTESLQSLDELYLRCQEDDDSAAEDVPMVRQYSLPEAKSAPFYCRFRLGVDTKREGEDGKRPTNTNKLTFFSGLDHVIPFALLPRDDDGNSTFSFQRENSVTANHSFRDFATATCASSNAIVIDDRDHSGSFWNFLGELLMASIRECAETKGVVKVFAMATPSVVVAASMTSKLYDLSKLSDEDTDDAADAKVEPCLQYNPGRDEYGLTGVRAVDLLLPAELDPDNPPPNETPSETAERKKEQVVALLFLWINAHKEAMTKEGSAHALFIVQRVPNLEAPETAKLCVCVGLFDETRSHLCKADPSRGRPFSVWTKEQKDGEHHSQRLTSATAAVSSLVLETLKMVASGKKREAPNPDLRHLIRSHVVTRLLKGSLMQDTCKVSWICCVKRAEERQAAADDQPYSNDTNQLRSYVVAPASHFITVRQMEVLSNINKYRLRRAPPNQRPTMAAVMQAPARGKPLASPNGAMMQRGYFQMNVRSRITSKQRMISHVKIKVHDVEFRARTQIIQMEKVARAKIDRAKTVFRLAEFARRRREAMERKKIEIRQAIAAANEERKRRALMKKKRQFTPPGRGQPPEAKKYPQRRATTPNVARRRPQPKLATAPEPPTVGPAKPKLGNAPRPPAVAASKKSAPPRAWASKEPASHREPMKPAAAPAASSPRVARFSQADVKKLESEEFMKRTMIESDFPRGARKIITDVFGSSSDGERLMTLSKGGAVPKRSTSFRQSKVSPTLPTSREADLTPEASSDEDEVAAVVPAGKNVASVKPPPKAAEAPQQPTPIASSRSSSRSSYRSPSRSPSPSSQSGRDEVVESVPLVEARKAQTPSPQETTLEPIPVESVPEGRRSNDEDEFYQPPQQRVLRVSREGGTRKRGSTTDTPPTASRVQSINQSHTVTRTVVGQPSSTFITLVDEPSATETTQNTGTSIRDVEEEPSETEETQDTGASVRAVEVEAGAPGRSQDVASSQSSTPSSPKETAEEASASQSPSAARRQSSASSVNERPFSSPSPSPARTPPLQEEAKPLEDVSASDDETDVGSGSEMRTAAVVPAAPDPEALAGVQQPTIDADTAKVAHRKRMQSADFGDLGTFDYGDEKPAAVAAPANHAATASVQSTSLLDASQQRDRRRSSIGHLMNDMDGDDDDLDVLDL